VKGRDVHALDDGRLVEHVRDARAEVFNLRFQLATGQLENTGRVKQAKKELARGLTVARERGIDVERELRRQRTGG
jgi:large subunit ribosomal protein L29